MIRNYKRTKQVKIRSKYRFSSSFAKNNSPQDINKRQMKKVTEKQFQKALETIALYKKQNFPKKSNELTAIFDDCFICPSVIIIDGDEEVTYKFINDYEYRESITILLSGKQYEDYVCVTEREFQVSRSNLKEMELYMADNIWRKK